MTVKKLINKLKELPQSVSVYIEYDGRMLPVNEVGESEVRFGIFYDRDKPTTTTYVEIEHD